MKEPRSRGWPSWLTAPGPERICALLRLVRYGVLAGIVGLVALVVPLASLALPQAEHRAEAATTATVNALGGLGKPNIIVIMTDDLDVGSLETLLAMPSDLPDRDSMMPFLKKYFVEEGITFTESFVTNSLCCPSRATYLTGKYPHNHRVLANIGPVGGSKRLDDRSTLATWLDATYWTGHIGKYLNGYGEWNERHPRYNPTQPAPHPSAEQTYHPPGWDRWYGLIEPYSYQMYGYRMNENGVIRTYGTAPEDYQTDVLSRLAQAFIADALAHRADQPFFLSLAPLAPHVEVNTATRDPDSTTWEASVRPAPRHLDTISLPLVPPYERKASFNEADISDKPLQVPLLDLKDRLQLRRQYRTRLEAMRAVDDLLGDLATALGPQIENTVLIFTSDNGYLLGEHRLNGKAAPYEPSIRVPLHIRLPQKYIQELGGSGYARRVSSALVVNNDLAPTIAELAGVAAPGVDGRSLLPALQAAMSGSVPSPWRRRFLVEHWWRGYQLDFPTHAAVRTGSLAATPNVLYVEYYDEFNAVVFREFYDLNRDKDQLQSTPKTVTARAQAAVLQSLRKCGASALQASCLTLEDK
jgi:N-acetylglucosamine-6-sulfatase